MAFQTMFLLTLIAHLYLTSYEPLPRRGTETQMAPSVRSETNIGPYGQPMVPEADNKSGLAFSWESLSTEVA